MKQKFVLFAFFLSLILTTNLSQVEAQTSADPIDLKVQTHVITAKAVDPRTVVLKDYLAKHNSPMQDNAADFVEAADKYGVDWKLVPAIAGVESTFGKRIPGGYNAYGWGVYGDHVIYFKSWKDGIYTLNQGMREKYLNRGLTEPYAMNRVYASSPVWGEHVAFFLADIEKFSKNYDLTAEAPSKGSVDLAKSYTSSATLALK